MGVRLAASRALLGAGDQSSTRTVYGAVAGLILIGIALIVLAVWLYRKTRPEPELLAPLERMDDRDWLRRDPAQQRRELDAVRPVGAKPVVREKQAPEVDPDFDLEAPALADFDDLQLDRPTPDVLVESMYDPLLTRDHASDNHTDEPHDEPHDQPHDTPLTGSVGVESEEPSER